MNNEINQLIELKNRMNKKFENINSDVFVDDYAYADFKVYLWYNNTNQTLKSSVRLQGCEISIRWKQSDKFYNNISFKALFERFNLTNFIKKQ